MAAKVTATAAKKPAAKRPAPRPRKPAVPALPAAPVEDAGDVEVLRLVSSGSTEELRVPLFSIDGTVYSIPARPRMNIALQFMHLSRAQGDTRAMDYLLDKLLGQEGYQALREYDDLTPAQFQQITAIASQLTLGALELPKD